MQDFYNLQRFIDAQNQDYETIVQELESGQKRGHWMWFIFPQIKELGRSEVAQRFAISCNQEAIAYLEHPILGTRLKQCTQLVMNTSGLDVEQIFPYPDDRKFHSSMTLFAASSKTDNDLFMKALTKFFGGKQDGMTLDILKSQDHDVIEEQ